MPKIDTHTDAHSHGCDTRGIDGSVVITFEVILIVIVFCQTRLEFEFSQTNRVLVDVTIFHSLVYLLLKLHLMTRIDL